MKLMNDFAMDSCKNSAIIIPMSGHRLYFSMNLDFTKITSLIFDLSKHLVNLPVITVWTNQGTWHHMELEMREEVVSSHVGIWTSVTAIKFFRLGIIDAESCTEKKNILPIIKIKLTRSNHHHVSHH